MSGKTLQSASLHNWYISRVEQEEKGVCYIAHGNVTGHPRLRDTAHIYTSHIQKVERDEENNEIILITRNTRYQCKVTECNFQITETREMIPEFDELKEKYGNREVRYETEKDSLLLVFSDHKRYYFEDAIADYKGKRYQFYIHVHVGMVQDSCLIWCDELEDIVNWEWADVRYFPHVQHLEFYCYDLSEIHLYIENVGDGDIFCSFDFGTMRIKAGERKRVSRENREEDVNKRELNHTDLYPALLLDRDGK